MYLEHNSQNLFFREPFGAVKTQSDITLRLAVSESGIPHTVKCIFCCGNIQLCEKDMSYIFEICGKNIYGCTFHTPEKGSLVWYYFRIETDSGTFYYGNNERLLGGEGKLYECTPAQKFQITVYDKNFKTPNWFKKSVAYQIFPDRFYNPAPDVKSERQDIIRRSWGDEPFYKAEQFGGEYLSNDFFGGTLAGIEEKLLYLKDLGISVIYLNPIFKAFSNHRYDTGDYELIDDILGNEDDFKSLCQSAEKLGIRIILDGVFNHTGSNSKYFNKNGEYDTVGAYQSESSPYYDWYSFGKNHDEYDCWWGMKTLPHTNEESKSFREYILSGENSIIKKWLRCGAYGWRLDVVDELPDFFVKELRENAKSVGEDNVIIGEVWEDASNKVSYGKEREYFLGGELDSVMNYPLRNALIDFALENIDSQEFSKRVMSLKENYPKEVFHSCLNMVSSHDVERILTVMGGIKKPKSKDEQSSFYLSGDALDLAKKRALGVAALQMTLPGVPCVYYGDETGMQGFADPFCRRTFDWNNINSDFAEQYKRWIKVRNSSGVFSGGEFESVYTIGSIYGFIRYNNDEQYIVIASFSSVFDRIRLDVGRFGITHMESILGEEVQNSDSGIFYIDIPEHWVKVFKCGGKS